MTRSDHKKWSKMFLEYLKMIGILLIFKKNKKYPKTSRIMIMPKNDKKIRICWKYQKNIKRLKDDRKFKMVQK